MLREKIQAWVEMRSKSTLSDSDSFDIEYVGPRCRSYPSFSLPKKKKKIEEKGKSQRWMRIKSFN